MIHGLLEVDVTKPRAVLRQHHKQSGESLSFTAFVAGCLAKAVDEHKAVQALRRGSKHLVLFEDVDVATRIEHAVGDENVVVPYIIRAANRKTVRVLHEEIRAAQRADVRDVVTRFRFLPIALYRPFVWAFTAIAARNPRLWKETMGTVGITSVGMFGNGAGWGIPSASPTALMVTVGGIAEKQTALDGHVATREYLSLTVSVDHDLVDGAPATRFTQRLKELLESGYGLDDSSGDIT
jgi:pyruvate/2-oxoglutarate dehydrogenase complex dihydrolipoamide acyltransferase (E2) component